MYILCVANTNIIELTASTDLDALLGMDDFDCYAVTGQYLMEDGRNRKSAAGTRGAGYRVTAELADGGELYLHTFSIEANAQHFITELSMGRVAYDLPRAIELEVEDGVTTLVRFR